MQGTETLGADEQLIEALKSLAPPRAPNTPDRTNRAALAALRRGLGQEPGLVPEMFSYVRELARVRQEKEGDAFLVASLFGLHPLDWVSAEGDRDRRREPWTQNFGNSLARLVAKLQDNQRSGPAEPDERAAPSSTRPSPQPGVERRFMALLAADREDIGHHLRSLMGLLRQHDVPVNWLQLLRDLGRWPQPERDVQRRWARSFWGSTTPDQSAVVTGATPSDRDDDSDTD